MAALRRRCARCAPTATWRSTNSRGSPPWSARVFSKARCTWCGPTATWDWRRRHSRRPHWRTTSTRTAFARTTECSLDGWGAEALAMIHDDVVEAAMRLPSLWYHHGDGPPAQLDDRHPGGPRAVPNGN